MVLYNVGYLVLGVDYYEGDGVTQHDNDPNFDLWAWADAKLVRARELMPIWIEAVKKEFGTYAFFSINRCF